MVGGVLTRKLLRDLWRRKGSLAALVVIVMIGTMIFVAYQSVYRDLYGAWSRYSSELRLCDGVIDVKRAPAWAVSSLEEMPGVERVRGRVSLSALIDLEDQVIPVAGNAISMPDSRERAALNNIRLIRGGWFSGPEADEVILDNNFAEAHGLRPGDRIKVTLLDKQHDLLVVGAATSAEFIYLIPPSGGFAPDPERYGVLYMPERFLQRSGDLEGAWNQVLVKSTNARTRDIENLLTTIEHRLDPYGVSNSGLMLEQASVKFLLDEMNGVETAAKIMPVIFLGVAALILNVIMSRLVAQERIVIGTLRALGYSRGAVFRHYLAFGGFVGLMGGVLGVLLGMQAESGLTAVYGTMFTMPYIAPHFYPGVMGIGLVIGIVFSLLGSLKGVRNAMRLEPAEAMRPPPPERGGKVLPERIPALWRLLPFRWKMIMRAVFRNPFRSGVTIFAGMISTAMILATVTMTDALDYLMEYQFDKMNHHDISVSLRDAEGDDIMTEITRLPGTAYAEQQLAVPCDLRRGGVSKRTAVTGLTQAHRLTTPLDKDGKPIRIPEQGLLLTKKLAEILDVQPGDTLHLRPLIGERREIEAPVVATYQTYMGLSAYADIGYLSRLLGEESAANTMLLRQQPGSDMEPFYAAIAKRPAVVGFAERERALNQVEEEFGQMMNVSLFIMVFIAGCVAFGSVFNSALVSLSERQREVGTLRVLGYTPLHVAEIFSGESFMLNFIGIVFGMGLGVALAYGLSVAYNTELYRFPTVVYPQRVVEAALIMAFFITAAQLVILRMIRKLDWLEVLKVKE